MKKNLIIVSFVLFAAAFLFSCKKDDGVSQQIRSYTFELLEEDSKAFLSPSHISWEDKDTIVCCILANDGSSTYHIGIVNPGTPRTFTISDKNLIIKPGDLLLAASGIPNMNYWHTQQFFVPDVQISSERPGALNYIPQVGNPFEFTEEILKPQKNPISGVTFRNVCSFITFDISATGDIADETVLSVELSSDQPLSGAGFIELVERVVSPSSSLNRVAVCANGEKASAASLTAAVFQGEHKNFKVTVKTDAATYTKSVNSTKDLILQRGHRKKMVIDLSTFSRTAVQAGFIPGIVPLDFGGQIDYYQEGTGSWLSLGMGTIEENFLFEDVAAVEIQQYTAEPNHFRVVAPFDALLERAEMYDPAYLPSEYLYFREQPVDGVSVTSPGLVYFDNADSGYFYSYYGKSIMLIHPGWFFPNIEDSYNWNWNKVLSYRADGLPSKVQLAPIYYMESIGGWPYHDVDNMVLITFPKQ